VEKKEQVQLAVIGAGLVVLVFFLITNLKTAAKRPNRPAAPEAAPAAASADAPVLRKRDAGRALGLQEKRWETAWGRDPFRAMSDTAGRLVELQLKGISFSPQKQGFAFINDQIVTVGDAVSGYTVSRIEKEKVVLTRDAQTFILSFMENEGQ